MTENNELTVIQKESTPMVVVQADSLQAIERAEIDSLVATAHAFPRNRSKVLCDIEDIATSDAETAASCFYSLNRGGKIIQGPSVRLSEIIRASYGNISVGSRIIANDGKTITAQGVCIDYEKNNRCSSEVKVRITDKNGKTYSEDMQVIVGNAACAKAERNAVFKVVPMALFKSILDKVKDVSVGKASDLSTTRSKLVEWYGKAGVQQDTLFEYLNISKVDEINPDMIVHLRGLCTSLKEGQTTIEEAIIGEIKNRKAVEESSKAVNDAVSSVMTAAKKSAKKSVQQESDPDLPIVE